MNKIINLTDEQYDSLVHTLENVWHESTNHRKRWSMVYLLEAITGNRYSPDHSLSAARINRKLAQGKIKFPSVSR